MSDTTITPEERAEWRSLVMPYPDGKIGNQDRRMLRLIDALEVAEARAGLAENSLQESISKQAQMAAGIEKVVSANHALAIKSKEQEERAKKAEAACQIAASAHATAQVAWGGETPSPLPGHKHMTEDYLVAMDAHLLPSALTWTTEPPTVVGKFWWRDKRHPNEACVINVTQTKLDGYRRHTIGEYEQFAGPIPEPKE